jgi:hypothetical protein
VRKETTWTNKKGVGGFLPFNLLILGVQDVFCNSIIPQKREKVKSKKNFQSKKKGASFIFQRKPPPWFAMDIIALFYYSNVLELIQVFKRKHFPTGIKTPQNLMQKPICKKLNFTSQNISGILNVSPGYVLNL